MHDREYLLIALDLVLMRKKDFLILIKVFLTKFSIEPLHYIHYPFFPLTKMVQNINPEDTPTPQCLCRTHSSPAVIEMLKKLSLASTYTAEKQEDRNGQ